MKQLLAAIILTALASSGQAQDAFLSGPQIRAKLTGKTISGTEGGVRYSEKLLANGTIKGRSSAEPDYDGEWEISGNEICFYYDSDDDDDCSRVILKGRSISFVDEDGSRSTAVVQ
ncbi:hypothetical protein [Pararhizobium sp. DWP1-1-3]|uniref:hypothetical protein n=1 Tax=Pararhizobium sp. DWP1-1-3 TaxID=2804652 RepID=UPI003CEEC09A